MEETLSFKTLLINLIAKDFLGQKNFSKVGPFPQKRLRHFLEKSR
jgi:hypothetical protein